VVREESEVERLLDRIEQIVLNPVDAASDIVADLSKQARTTKCVLRSLAEMKGGSPGVGVMALVDALCILTTLIPGSWAGAERFVR